ncbi:MAG: efflux RND transporter periplasmic adaptor subunit [Gammaproteobacteria bacterium]
MNTVRILSLFTAVALLAACGHPSSGGQDAKQGDTAERKVLYYRNPMIPTVTSPVPTKDNMGMDYIPVYAGEGAGGTAIHISPAIQENLGILTAPARREDLHRQIHTVGYVDYDESTVLRLHTRADGWITQLPITSAGESVSKGQLLFKLYSPTLVTAEQEYAQAVKGGNTTFIEASEKRLHALGIADDEIARLKRTSEPSKSIAYYAERTGVVQMLNARPGQQVTTDMEVMRLGVFSRVWLVAEVFENEAGWVAVGERAEARFASAPGEVMRGTVNFVPSELDSTTRALKVRMTFTNPDAALKANMYAEVTIEGTPEKSVLTVPGEALIRTGDGDRVILALGNGRFQAQAVTAGIESGGRVAILSGLKDGETVVISGQFLIDSDASLKASLARLSENQDMPEAGK